MILKFFRFFALKNKYKNNNINLYKKIIISFKIYKFT